MVFIYSKKGKLPIGSMPGGKYTQKQKAVPIVTGTAFKIF